MIRDPILEELWKAKDAVAAEHGYDVRKLIRSLAQARPAAEPKMVEPEAAEPKSAAGRPAKSRRKAV